MRWPSRLPLGLLPLVVPGSAVAAAALLHSLGEGFFQARYQEWISISVEFHEALQVAGPIAAASATYYAGRLSVPGRIFGHSWSPRTGQSLVVRHIGTIATAMLVGYLAGLAPLFALGVLDAQAGGPHLLTILTGIIGLLAIVAVGYLIGVLFGSAWLAPLTLIAAFLTLGMSIENERLATSTPVTNIRPGLGWVESTPFVIYRLALFVLIAAAAGNVASRSISRVVRLKVPGPRSIVLAALVLVGVVVPVITKPAVLAVADDRPSTCERHNGVEFCVHAGRRSDLEPIRTGFERILTLAGHSSDQPRRVRDTALASPEERAPTGLIRRTTARTVWVALGPWRSTPADQEAAQATAHVVAGLVGCDRQPSDSDEPTASEMLAWELAGKLTEEAGYGGFAGPNHFADWSAQRLTTWMAANRVTIAECALTAASVS